MIKAKLLSKSNRRTTSEVVFNIFKHQKSEKIWKKKRFLVLFSALLVCVGLLYPTRLGQHLASSATNILDLTFTYHSYSELYRSENQSVFQYDGADTKDPVRDTAFQCTFKCERQDVQSGFTVWTGAVSWVTLPLVVDAKVFGAVTLITWMSSTDENVGLGSGYGMTLMEIDEGDNIIWNQSSYKQSIFGKAIASTPSEYTITLNVNHTFEQGHKIVFAVGAGCTNRGWTVNVFFDSRDKHSRAIVPFDRNPFSPELSKVIIDQSFVSNFRVNIGTPQEIGFHVKWHNGSDVIGGTVLVNKAEYVTNKTGWIVFTEKHDNVGERSWVISGVNCNGVTSYEQVSETPFIIWDQITIIDGGVSNTQANLSQKETVWFQAIYEYDHVNFDSSKGVLMVNGTPMTWSAIRQRWEYNCSYNSSGTRHFKISNVSDYSYGLTTINDLIGDKSITWCTDILGITCFVSPVQIQFQESINVFGSITPAQSGIPVTLIYEHLENSPITRTVTTKFDGSYSDPFYPEISGSWRVTASWSWNSGHASSDPVLFLVVEETNKSAIHTIDLLVLSVIAGLLILICFTIYFKHKQRQNRDRISNS